MLELGFWKHSKTGNLYTVLHQGKSSEDPAKEFVVYRAEYESHNAPRGQIWIRPLHMWEEEVLLPNGERVPRFVKVSLTDEIDF